MVGNVIVYGGDVFDLPIQADEFGHKIDKIDDGGDRGGHNIGHRLDSSLRS